MPRDDMKSHQGTQFYHSQYNQYLPEPSSATSSSTSTSQPSPSQSQVSASPTTASLPPKKKHVCPTCDRAFTTSGHLARHSRVHTGERNHKCPFPGCETRCSRQDNLQQHYRIHLSPGSRRSSARSAIARAMNSGVTTTKRGSASSTTPERSTVPPPPLSPPALEPARIYNHHATPPDSPPPLAQATLPATAHLHETSSSRSSSTSSPATPYSSLDHNLVSLTPAQNLSLSNTPSPQQYSYRTGTSTYQEQSQGAGFTYVHTTPISHPSSNSNANSFSSYSNGHHDFGPQSVQHLNGTSLHQAHTRENSPSNSSRHSISHISHPQTQNYAQSAIMNPPSPASSQSVSSHNSGPPTPTYPVYNEEGHPYQNGGMMADQGHMSQSHMVPGNYPLHNGRFDSPSPTLAPIQGERYVRRADRHHPSHQPSPYIHHPQPLTTDFSYHHQSLGLGHVAWKAENGMRKGLGALVQ